MPYLLAVAVEYDFLIGRLIFSCLKHCTVGFHTLVINTVFLSWIIMRCPVALRFTWDIEITIPVILLIIHTAPTFLVVDFTKLVGNFLCCSDTVILFGVIIIFIQNKTDFCVTVRRLYLPDNGISVGIGVIHKTLPYGTFQHFFAAAGKLCFKPKITVGKAKFLILIMCTGIICTCLSWICKICLYPCAGTACTEWLKIMLARCACIIVPEIDIVCIISWQYPVLIGRTRYRWVTVACCVCVWCSFSGSCLQTGYTNITFGFADLHTVQCVWYILTFTGGVCIWRNCFLVPQFHFRTGKFSIAIFICLFNIYFRSGGVDIFNINWMIFFVIVDCSCSCWAAVTTDSSWSCIWWKRFIYSIFCSIGDTAYYCSSTNGNSCCKRICSVFFIICT